MTTTEHNHPVLPPAGGFLHHPDSDPRKLCATCPRCAELMREWALKIRQITESGE